LTADGVFTYTWDAENRLTSVVPVTPYSAGDVKLELYYDYMGRRVGRIVSTYNGRAWVPSSLECFIYDGWNVVMVYDMYYDVFTHKYTWGLDLSGQSGGGTTGGIHDAGGIGGLLACYDTNGTAGTGDDDAYWYFYDGNGNVGQLIDAGDYSTAAAYEYGPYGNTIASSGSYADDNPFRFSTKWLDHEPAAGSQAGAIAETGLYYYGYRYYSPALGRWMSRDPIEEQGGYNLYVYAQNSSIDHFDPAGLRIEPPVSPVPAPPVTHVECWTTRAGSACIRCCARVVGGAVIVLCMTDSCGGPRCPCCGAYGQEPHKEWCECMKRPSPPEPEPDPEPEPEECEEEEEDECTKERKRELDRLVGVHCKGAPRRCNAGMSCEELEIRRQRNLDCWKARNDINRICFGGGDQTHQDLANRALQSAQKCNDIMRANDCPGVAPRG